MNQKRVLNALASLGLTKTDIRVYVYLSMNGPQQENNIAATLNLQQSPLHSSLQNLEDKKFVTSAQNQTQIFFAKPLDKVLDTLVKIRLSEAQEIEQAKNDILNLWKNMTKERTLNNQQPTNPQKSNSTNS